MSNFNRKESSSGNLPPIEISPDDEGPLRQPRCELCQVEDDNLGSGIISLQLDRILCHGECYLDLFLFPMVTFYRSRIKFVFWTCLITTFISVIVGSTSNPTTIYYCLIGIYLAAEIIVWLIKHLAIRSFISPNDLS